MHRSGNSDTDIKGVAARSDTLYFMSMGRRMSWLQTSLASGHREDVQRLGIQFQPLRELAECLRPLTEGGLTPDQADALLNAIQQISRRPVEHPLPPVVNGAGPVDGV